MHTWLLIAGVGGLCCALSLLVDVGLCGCGFCRVELKDCIG